MRFLEVDLGTSLGLVGTWIWTWSGPGPGPGSGPGSQTPVSQIPVSQILVYLLRFPVKRPYEPINLEYMLKGC